MRSPTDHTARLRGAAVGVGSGAVAIFAHGLGGGNPAPDGSALALLFVACGLIGVLVASFRPRYGPLSTMGMLAAGQTIGHTALSMSPEHHHHTTSAAMLAAHLVAIPVGALLIRAAEAGLRRAITSVRRFILTLDLAPLPGVHPARRAHTGDRAPLRRLLLSSGIGRRGPPFAPATFSHLVPA
ncbi:hypothetical protein [Nocardia huaxiensis]|uniref:hypothetical protein n=1 Tax=Nocardia huaxiensis TaxID=2755382 RepID=UPI001E44BBB9|nr:hypothetical protein [Nocardia huaxiensis]UFS98633.1 hypothetical protein LPY97_12405 [Nocardia huaxiensis]